MYVYVFVHVYECMGMDVSLVFVLVFEFFGGQGGIFLRFLIFLGTLPLSGGGGSRFLIFLRLVVGKASWPNVETAFSRFTSIRMMLVLLYVRMTYLLLYVRMTYPPSLQPLSPPGRGFRGGA
jgi:hypothetical protein